MLFDKNTQPQLAWGFYPSNSLPGWNRISYGFHSGIIFFKKIFFYHIDDGKVYTSSGTGFSYSTGYTTGDVIGKSSFKTDYW